MKTAAIIPARYNSKRLKNKPLLKVNGRPLIKKVYDKLAKILDPQDIYVVSDSKKVLEIFSQKKENLILSESTCLNGTERCSKALNKIKKGYDNFLIISCDIPYLRLDLIKFLLNKRYHLAKGVDAITVHKKITNKEMLFNKSVAKIVSDKNNNVLYISRNSIPSVREDTKTNHYSHHGFVLIKKNTLKKYKLLKNTNLQLAEDNEWLKLIENGYKIKSFLYNRISSEINNKKDLKKYFNYYKK
jgi:3-deoxy-manno-octulosonate cytidylyltransferase (CMP-KDO synthetase)